MPMGLLDEIENLAGSAQRQQAADPKIANGLLQALQEHPGGIGGLLATLRQHGMGSHVDAWTGGQQQPATPEQVQQALGPTGLIERTAQHAGVSPQIAAVAISTILPLLIRHFAPGGQPVQQSQIASLASGLLGKLL